MPQGHTIDGALAAWPEVAGLHEWRALFLGNGLSSHVWGKFAYASLFEQATTARSPTLGSADRVLFKAYGTENFETVLGNLSTAIQTNEALSEDCERLYERYFSVQRALGAAVRRAHILRAEVPDETLHTIKKVISRQRAVFTTSYDLILYWAMGYPLRLEDDFWPMADCFWFDGNAFNCPPTIWPDRVPVWFPHGALHLVESAGVTRKLVRRPDATLLDQFGAPLAGDRHARPLLITEGSWRDKLRAIEANSYLNWALEQLRGCDRPMVVFGSSLGEQDKHLVNALNEHPERSIAISIRPKGGRSKIRAQQAEFRGRLETSELYFYDSTTYPLGAPGLTARRVFDFMRHRTAA
jgi:hypothetical protein